MYGTNDDAKTLGGKVGAAIERYPSLWKVVDTDSIKLSIEKSLMKSFAIYLYIESLIKSFVLQTGENCFVIENVFGAEAIRRLNCCMIKNSSFRCFFLNYSPFAQQKFQLHPVEIQFGIGVPHAKTHIDVGNSVRYKYGS